MAAPKGNRFWEARSTHNAKRIMEDPQALMEACVEYFNWVQENPITETKVGFSNGRAVSTIIEHPQAMTVWGISSFLGIVSVTWYDWRKNRPDLKDIIIWAEEVMRIQKFSAAAAGLLNANLIAREMHLADHQVQQTTTPQMIINPPEGEQIEQPPIEGE